MTIEVVLIIIGFCLFACYLVFKWQESAVDMAIPPYQEPVQPEPVQPEPDLTQQWVQATKADTLDNIDNWNAKVGDKIWYKQDDGALTPAQLEQITDTVLNPKAAWPFPSGSKP